MEEKLKKILLHSYNTVEYYKEIFDTYKLNLNAENIYEEIQKLPVLKKEIIISEREKFISNVFRREDLLKEYTSGSTGRPANIYKSTGDRINIGKELWRMRKRYGITINDKMCKFHLLQYNNEKELISIPVSYGKNHISLSMLHLNDEHLENYYQVLREENVKWIFGAPSAIYRLGDYILRNNYPVIDSIKYIELTGEYRTDEMKKRIKKAFGCEVVDFYGLREVNGVASSCDFGRMHCFDTNVFIEVLNDEGQSVKEGETGQIHITSLNNYAMPFIRYDTGDRGRIFRNVKCECGMHGNVIELESTRTVEYIRCKDGTQLNSGVLYCALLEMNRTYPGLVIQFQIIQKHYNNFHIKLNLGLEDIETEEVIEIFKKLAKKFGMYDAEWTYEVVDNIEISKETGKTRYFIREDF